MGTAVRAVLDTSVVIATDVGPLTGELAISVATLAELNFGVLIAREPAVRAERLRRLSIPYRRFDALPIDDAVAAGYGQLAAAMVDAGRRSQARTSRSWPRPANGPLSHWGSHDRGPHSSGTWYRLTGSGRVWLRSEMELLDLDLPNLRHPLGRDAMTADAAALDPSRPEQDGDRYLPGAALHALARVADARPRRRGRDHRLLVLEPGRAQGCAARGRDPCRRQTRAEFRMPAMCGPRATTFLTNT
ncbi:hypothetical protein [Pseudonocardia asaccharolytica]|uniref:PIN domain-containing protein n=1 Tax=Pseudonocardia asaccharolytica DSM 44247 = NBRC 16224 TaxID=1123024 RepID=A0A511CWL3_9PSEU|nr:hypothetical protein [Pseudonocardia asaccharolytica]GEL16867.1 hypothetical protein PA7_07040 [Pseudonocardia asaccharolytica DSM 44247 = NBRC 16224]